MVFLSLAPGCGGDDDGVNPSDGTAPAGVTDLAAVGTNAVAAVLTWTAPGDDGTAGKATEYDIRYATSVITEANWSSATPMTPCPAPRPAGTSEYMTVGGLDSETTYHFALKTADEVPNWSGLSNVVNATTTKLDTIPPAEVTDLACVSTTASSASLTWTAPGDDGTEGAAREYDIRYSTSVITDANWESAMQATGCPVPSPAGTQESMVITGLTEYTTYYFALKAADERPNWGGMSNVGSAKTKDVPVLITTFEGSETYPDWSPDGSEFAFTWDSSGNEDIWVIPVTGGTPVQLTVDSGIDRMPRWSPDGSQIAFWSNRGGTGHIWVIPAAGGTPSQVTTGPDYDYGPPSWSPDGSQIAFWRNQDIYVIPAAGGAATQITFDSALDGTPDWSPDGSTIAFGSYRDPNGIWTIPATGGTAVYLNGSTGAHPIWSPDGSRIAFFSTASGNGDLWVIPATGGTAVQFTTWSGWDYPYSWSPDGSKIAFYNSRRDGATYDIWTIRVE